MCLQVYLGRLLKRIQPASTVQRRFDEYLKKLEELQGDGILPPASRRTERETLASLGSHQANTPIISLCQWTKRSDRSSALLLDFEIGSGSAHGGTLGSPTGIFSRSLLSNCVCVG